MDSNTLRKSKEWFLTGCTLVNTVIFSFILLSLTLISGHGLSAIHFPLAVFLSLLLNYFAVRHFLPEDFLRVFIRSSVIVLGVIVLSILLSVSFYDVSMDGQLYHLEPSLQMKAGWNPFKSELPVNTNQAIWLNHYAKGVEYAQATIYAVTNRIEGNKSTNFMLLAGSFFLTLSLLLRLDRFSYRKSVLFSILFAFNPVSFYQLLSAYLDGQLCSFLLCFIVIACYLYLEIDRYYLMMLSFLLIFILNIKFTAVVFAAIFTMGMLFTFLITKGWKVFRPVFIVCCLSTIVGIGVFGYFPYVLNTIHYHDPLYPGMKLLQDEATLQAPRYFKELNRFSKFVISFFSHTDDLHLFIDRNPDVPPKIPFTLNRIDLYNAVKPIVPRMAGFGPFFSGVFISAVALFVLFLFRVKNWTSRLPILIMLGTLLVSVIVVSEAWFARYAPQFWFVPLILLLVSEADRRKNISRFRNLMYAILLVNISFCLGAFPYLYYQSAKIQYELDQLKASHQTIQVHFTYFTSNRARFLENGIPYREIIIPDSGATHIVSSSTKYLVPSEMPDLPKPWPMRLGDELSQRFAGFDGRKPLPKNQVYLLR